MQNNGFIVRQYTSSLFIPILHWCVQQQHPDSGLEGSVLTTVALLSVMVSIWEETHGSLLLLSMLNFKRPGVLHPFPCLVSLLITKMSLSLLWTYSSYRRESSLSALCFRRTGHGVTEQARVLISKLTRWEWQGKPAVSMPWKRISHSMEVWWVPVNYKDSCTPLILQLLFKYFILLSASA